MLAKLSGGVAVINVGAATEVEMKEKKDRVDDAQHATQCAVEEGVIPGGGTAFIRAIPVLKNLLETLEGDQKVGVQIVMKAISAPLNQIAENAGLEGAVVRQKVAGLEGNQGFNALTNTYEDLVQAGILDPTKVTRLALENAASVASMLITMEAAVAEMPEDEKAAMPAMPAGMDY